MKQKIEEILLRPIRNSEMADAILATISDGCEPVYQAIPALLADLEEAQAKLAVLQEKYDNDCSSLELRVAAAEKDAGTYTDSIAELKNMEYRVNGLAHTWEFRADDALPVDAMLIMKMRRELCNAIAAGKETI